MGPQLQAALLAIAGRVASALIRANRARALKLAAWIAGKALSGEPSPEPSVEEAPDVRSPPIPLDQEPLDERDAPQAG